MNTPLEAVQQATDAQIDLRKIAKQVGINMDCWDMGAASLAYSKGCTGITRAHLERFAALYGFACWNAALEANPPHMLGMVSRAIDSSLAATQPVPPRWMPIETAPKDGRKLMLFYRNRNDKARTVLARWLTDEEAAETDADDVGLEGGWYECIDNWNDYTEVAIHEGEPTHWQPLPPPPAASQGAKP